MSGRRPATAPSSPMPPHLQFYRNHLGNDITIDVNIGPSTSSAYARAQGSTAWHHAHRHHGHSSSPSPALHASRSVTDVTADPAATHLETPADETKMAAGPSRSRASSLGYGGLSATTPGTEDTDPLLLRSRLVEDSEVRRRHSGKGKNRRNERQIRDFYESKRTHRTSSQTHLQTRR